MESSPESIRQSLFKLTSRGIKYDLQRIASAADRAGNPHTAYRSVHVAGTNGKGSTCAYIESVLRAAGFRTGLFTSPHISAFEERFRIDGEMVKEEEWVAVYNDQRSIIEFFKLTFFEATMLMATELFRRRGVEWAVFETGLGGRLDATNIITPRVCVITRLAIDHRQYLGNTLAEIAAEKLGIVKENTPLIMERPVDENILESVESVCRSKKAPCLFVSIDDAQSVMEEMWGNRWCYHNLTWENRLPGRYQIINAMLAIEAILHSGERIDIYTIQKGIAGARIEGRFQQIILCGKTVIFDVGHNPDSAAALCATLRKRFPGRSVCFVTGIMADKDYSSMISIYDSVGSHIIFTNPKTERAAKAETLAKCLTENKRTICPDVGEALELALKRNEDVVCVTGSFYTVGEALERIKVKGMSATIRQTPA